MKDTLENVYKVRQHYDKDIGGIKCGCINEFYFIITRDKSLEDKWRLVNLTSGTILKPSFDSKEEAIEWLYGIPKWDCYDVDVSVVPTRIYNKTETNPYMAENQINKTALEVIESEIPDFDYESDIQKEAALQFMYSVNGVLDITKALIGKAGEHEKGN